MRIPRRHYSEEPEINLIPMVDVLLVIIIFLAVSTTFAVDRHVEVNLAKSQITSEVTATTLELTITADGQFALADHLLSDSSLETLTRALARQPNVSEQTVLVIRADASTAHQNVINAMQAAREVGLSRVSFAARLGN